MKDAGYGRIVNITSSAGLRGNFGQTNYGAAKAAIMGMTFVWALELGKYGITVNSIPPGRINSEQIRRNYAPEYRKWQADNEIPVGRYGEPEDVALVVMLLASPRASYFTGIVVPVDGGLRRYQF